MALLILTIGTGTSGKHSNLAQGMVNTLDQLRPRLFWLVPSASPDSITVADMVREGAPAKCSFQPWSSSQKYRCIGQPDDLLTCREVLREVIQAAGNQRDQGEPLVVNPTSGTKQMSAAAVLAALDEGIGELVFTVGDRVDGVVKTGTERMAAFDTERFFFDRDLRIAQRLFEAGAFLAAHKVLGGYTFPEATRPRHVALCLHHWQRMAYDEAAHHAGFSRKLQSHLLDLAKEPALSTRVLGDLLAGADELLRWGDAEEAMARYYRAAEETAKLRLSQAFQINSPYALDALKALLPERSELRTELPHRARGRHVQIGLDLAWRYLAAIGDALGTAWSNDPQLQTTLERRHEGVYGHGKRPIDAEDVRDIADRLRRLLKEHLPGVDTCWNTQLRPRTLVDPVSA